MWKLAMFCGFFLLPKISERISTAWRAIRADCSAAQIWVHYKIISVVDGWLWRSSIQRQETFTPLCIATATKWPILLMMLIRVCAWAPGRCWEQTRCDMSVCVCVCVPFLRVCPCLHVLGYMCVQACMCVCVWHFTYDTTHPSLVFDFGKQLICLVCKALTFCRFCRQRAVFCLPSIRKETKVTHRAAVSLMASCVNVLPERQAFSRGGIGEYTGKVEQAKEWENEAV